MSSAQSHAPVATAPGPILHLACSDALSPGRLYELFRRGVRAVVLHDLPELSEAWSSLCETAHPPDGAPPWQSSYLDVARNHHPAAEFADHLGDLIVFDPGGINYMARKVRVERSAQGIAVHPAVFRHASGDQRFPEKLAERTLRLCERLAQSSLPAAQPAPRVEITIERLQYVADGRDLDRVHALSASAAARRVPGPYERLGRRLDVLRAQLDARLSERLDRAVNRVSHLPGMGGVLRRQSLKRAMQAVPDDARVIGGVHIDDRFLVALASRRNALRTELFAGGRWHTIPLASDTLTIMPCRDAMMFGVEPTWHRVLQVPPEGPSCENLTLCFGIELFEP